MKTTGKVLEISVFQFLIGKVQHKEKTTKKRRFETWFQFLIGKVQREITITPNNGEEVSIPYR